MEVNSLDPIYGMHVGTGTARSSDQEGRTIAIDTAQIWPRHNIELAKCGLYRV